MLLDEMDLVGLKHCFFVCKGDFINKKVSIENAHMNTVIISDRSDDSYIKMPLLGVELMHLLLYLILERRWNFNAHAFLLQKIGLPSIIKRVFY